MSSGKVYRAMLQTGVWCGVKVGDEESVERENGPKPSRRSREWRGREKGGEAGELGVGVAEVLCCSVKQVQNGYVPLNFKLSSVYTSVNETGRLRIFGTLKRLEPREHCTISHSGTSKEPMHTCVLQFP